MTATVHQRPGVYSSYDASSVVGSGKAAKTIGLAAPAAKDGENKVRKITSYTEGLEIFGSDTEGAVMAKMMKLAFLNGASTVEAVAVKNGDYATAFEKLSEIESVGIMLCGSGEVSVHQTLRDSVQTASGARHERVGIVGGNAETAEQLVAHAADINSERMVLVGGDVYDSEGTKLPGYVAAAAVAGAVASTTDPAIPLNGAELSGLGAVSQSFDDNTIDALVLGGVTPLECVSGIVSPVRGITTKTKTGGESDSTWRELTTILIVDEVIPAIRRSLRAKFSRSKNTKRTRGAVRSAVIVELENYLSNEVIDSYGDVTVGADSEDATVCVVEFSFAVAHGLNRIYMTAHITV